MKRSVFIASAALALAGIALIVSHMAGTHAAARSHGWQQARGTIEKAAAGTSKPLDVVYRYTFGGREYRSTVITLGALTAADVKPRLQRYAAGTKVLVYVNPANPAEAALEIGQRPAKTTLIAGWSMIYVGAIGALAGWRWSTPQRKKNVRKATRPMQRLRPPPPIPRK